MSRFLCVYGVISAQYRLGRRCLLFRPGGDNRGSSGIQFLRNFTNGWFQILQCGDIVGIEISFRYSYQIVSRVCWFSGREQERKHYARKEK